MLDPAVDKDTLLVLFANHVYMGNADGEPVLGLEAAAQVYFDVPFARNDEQQFLQLVAMMLAPNRLDPREHAEANLARVRRIEATARRRVPPVWLDGCRTRWLQDVTKPRQVPHRGLASVERALSSLERRSLGEQRSSPR